MPQEPKLTSTAAAVIQAAHGFTIAHRAVIGTTGKEREIKRAERTTAEKKLLSDCDRDRNKAET